MKLNRLALVAILAFSSFAHASIPVVPGADCGILFASVKHVVGSEESEAHIRAFENWQISMIDGTMLGKSDTPPFFFETSADQQGVYTVKSGGLNGVISHVNVSHLGAEGILRGTLLLPVSGHNGFEKAKQWAKTDTYNVYMQVGEGPNGDQFPSYSSSLIPVAVNAPSTDIITRKEIAIPMIKGKQVRVLYWRNGSAGIAGYPEGRLMTFSWDGK